MHDNIAWATIWKITRTSVLQVVSKDEPLKEPFSLTVFKSYTGGHVRRRNYISLCAEESVRRSVFRTLADRFKVLP